MGSWGSISILTASLLGVWGFLEGLTSTGTYLVPRERFQDTDSITLASDFLLRSFDAFMPLGAIGTENGHVVCYDAYPSGRIEKQCLQ